MAVHLCCVQNKENRLGKAGKGGRERERWGKGQRGRKGQGGTFTGAGGSKKRQEEREMWRGTGLRNSQDERKMAGRERARMKGARVKKEV